MYHNSWKPVCVCACLLPPPTLSHLSSASLTLSVDFCVTLSLNTHADNLFYVCVCQCSDTLPLSPRDSGIISIHQNEAERETEVLQEHRE